MAEWLERKGTTIRQTCKYKIWFRSARQIIIADSEDNLHRGVFITQNITKRFGMEIPTEKSETVDIMHWLSKIFYMESIF